MDQQQIVDGLRAERVALTAYLADLGEGRWTEPSLCEGWRVRDVVAHLAGNVTDVLAGRLEGAGSDEYNQRQVDERADRTPAELLEEFGSRAPGLEDFYAAFTPEQWAQELPRFGTLGDGIHRQLYDLWVHVQDIRVALGDPPSEGPGARASLEAIARDIARQVRRAIPTMGSLTLEDGAEPIVLSLADGGTAVRLRASAPVIVLIATGRMALADAVERGEATVDPATATTALGTAINIYAPA